MSVNCGDTELYMKSQRYAVALICTAFSHFNLTEIYLSWK